MRYLYAKADAPAKFISCEKTSPVVLSDKKLMPLDAYTLLYTKSGSLKITSSGRIFDVKKYHFALLFKNEPYEISYSEKSEVFKLSFDVSNAYHMDNIEFFNLLTKTNREDKNIFLIPENGYNIINNKLPVLFSKILEVQKQKNKWSPYMMHYSLSMFLSEVTYTYLKIYKKSNEPTFDTVSLISSLIKHWIDQNYQKNLNIKEIAKIFGYNSHYLTTLYRENTGFTLIEYIHKLKLDKSKHLLRNSSLSIKDIAYESGFDSDKYFMKLFKKFEEITPSEYRKLYSQQ